MEGAGRAASVPTHRQKTPGALPPLSRTPQLSLPCRFPPSLCGIMCPHETSEERGRKQRGDGAAKRPGRAGGWGLRLAGIEANLSVSRLLQAAGGAVCQQGALSALPRPPV
ncbi:unnamed protein product [Eretmochelys imbricata]